MSSSALDGAVDYAALGSGSFADANPRPASTKSCTRLAGTSLDDPNLATDEVDLPSDWPDDGPDKRTTTADLTRDLSASIHKTAASMGLVLRDPEQTVTRQGELPVAAVTRASVVVDAMTIKVRPKPKAPVIRGVTAATVLPPALVNEPASVPTTVGEALEAEELDSTDFADRTVARPRQSMPLLERDDPDARLGETLARPFPVAFPPFPPETRRESPGAESPSKPAFVYPTQEEIVTRESNARPDLAERQEKALAAPPAPPPLVLPASDADAPVTTDLPVLAAFGQTMVLPQGILPKLPANLVEAPPAGLPDRRDSAGLTGSSGGNTIAIRTPLVMITEPEDRQTRIAPSPLPPMPMPPPVVITPHGAVHTPPPGMMVHTPPPSRAATPTVQVVTRPPFPVGRVVVVALATFLLAAMVPFVLRQTTVFGVSAAPPPAPVPVAGTTPAMPATAEPPPAPVVVAATAAAPAPPPTTSARVEGPRKRPGRGGHASRAQQ